jgi:hypothetical protein
MVMEGPSSKLILYGPRTSKTFVFYFIHVGSNVKLFFEIVEL